MTTAAIIMAVFSLVQALIFLAAITTMRTALRLQQEKDRLVLAFIEDVTGEMTKLQEGHYRAPQEVHLSATKEVDKRDQGV